MVVKSATKKKLMDLGIEEEYAHKLADDRKWDDVKGLSPGQIAQICGIDSGTSQRIHDVMASSVKSSRASAASSEKTIVRRRTVSRRRRTTRSLPLQDYDYDSKMKQLIRDIDHEDEMYIQLNKAAEKEGSATKRSATAENNNVSCATCQLCEVKTRKSIVYFPANGTQKKTVNNILNKRG